MKARHTCRSGLVGLWLLVACLPGTRAAADVVISEILASNQFDLVDEDGDTPDWLELHNEGDEPVDLDGWYLTDSLNEPTKWRFPAVVLDAGSYLVVYCSGKERDDPTRPLHTNFDLDRDGEYLALIKPGGRTVEWQFFPRYEQQIRDVSYGYVQDIEEFELIGSHGDARYVVPSDGSLGLGWIEPTFDDSAWSVGPTAVGFDQKSRPTYSDLIKTDIGEAMRRVNPSAYLRIPFQIDDPDAFDLLQLRMKFEDGFVAYLNGVEVASANAPADPGWDSRSSGRQSTVEATTFRNFDLTAWRDLLVAGENLLAIHGMNDSVSSSDFFVLPELVGVRLVAIDVDRRQFFTETTPGWPNGVGYDGVSPGPIFSVPSGSFTEPLAVELTTPDGTGEIRYTLDRSEPDAGSTRYESPIAIDRSTVVKARVFEPDLLPSQTVTSTYIFLHSSVADFDSKLPIVVVSTFGGVIPGTSATTYGPMQLTMFAVREETGRASLTDPPDYVGKGGIRVRGASSSGFPKKNYSMETWDVDDDDLDVPLLGLPSESDWVLHGPYSDKTLMRNVLSYQWSNAVDQWASRTQFVELYLNTSSTGVLSTSHYWGVYVLIEKIKLGPQRVDVRELNRSDNEEPAITGGYIIKKDRLDPGDSGFRTRRITGDVPFNFYDPKEDEITPEQRAYLLGYLDDFETALYGANFTDPDEGYRKYIDTRSFIDHHIIVELTKNIDGFRLSTFYHKDFNGKLKMGPVWDYNLSLGNADYLQGWQPTGWYYPQISQQQYPWFTQIFRDPEFQREYNARWGELRKGPLSLASLLADIDARVEEIEEAAERNFQKWRRLGVYDWPNAPGYQNRRTYASEIAFMKNWLTQRVAWMDSQLTSPPEFSHPGGLVEAGLEVELTAPNGEIFYTLDGTDPRGSGNDPSASAIEYDGTPIRIDTNVEIRARALIEGRVWSDLVSAAYFTSIPTLAITEVMYNPLGGTDYEFIEIFNYGDRPAQLRGASFRRGVTLTLRDDSPEILAPGEYVVVVRDRDAFSQRYGPVTVAGVYSGSLSDRSERITLEGAASEPIASFSYRDDWYPETDGAGHSLVLLDPQSDPETWGEPESWRPSTLVNGSPGAADPDEAPRGAQIPGDMSQDGVLGMTDAVQLLLFLFTDTIDRLPCDGGLAEAPNLLLLNANGDFQVDESDAIYVLTYLFLGGPPPFLGTECVEIDGCPEICSLPEEE